MSAVDLMVCNMDYINRCRQGNPTRRIQVGDRHRHLRIIRLEGFHETALEPMDCLGELRRRDSWEAVCDCGRTVLVDGREWRNNSRQCCGCDDCVYTRECTQWIREHNYTQLRLDPKTVA